MSGKSEENAVKTFRDYLLEGGVRGRVFLRIPEFAKGNSKTFYYAVLAMEPTTNYSGVAAEPRKEIKIQVLHFPNIHVDTIPIGLDDKEATKEEVFTLGYQVFIGRAISCLEQSLSKCREADAMEEERLFNLAYDNTEKPRTMPHVIWSEEEAEKHFDGPGGYLPNPSMIPPDK